MDHVHQHQRIIVNHSVHFTGLKTIFITKPYELNFKTSTTIESITI